MSNKILYNLSNKIRTILLTTIDKEILICSQKNHLLINSQSQEQLMKKFVNYRDFTMESEESFRGVQNNEDNNIFYDLRCIYSNNKFSFFCNSFKKSKQCLFFKNFPTKPLPLKKINVNSKIKKIENSKISQDDIYKVKIDSRTKLLPENKSSFSCNEIIDLKNLVVLSNNNRKYKKKFSADLYFYDIDNKNDDSTKLINYCNYLKKPKEEIINEISDDDTPAKKKNKKNILASHKFKNNYKSIIRNYKIKKTINKKKSYNKNNHNNDDSLFSSPKKKKSTNFTNEVELYFDNIEKSNQKERKKTKHMNRKLSSTELKETHDNHWKNIFKLKHCSKSLDKKSKEKKLEQTNKLFGIQLINKKTTFKKVRNVHFNSIDNTSIILKNKEKKEKKEKNDSTINIVNNKRFPRKHPKSSRTLVTKNNKFQQNEILCLENKIMNNYVNNKNENKNVDISNINYNNKIIYTNDTIKIKRNFKKTSSYHKNDVNKFKNENCKS